MALKVLTADAIIGAKHIDELRVLQRTMSTDPHHVGYGRIVALLDHFEHQGPHGTHLCLVLELLGPSISVVRQLYERQGCEIPLAVVKRITKQILFGLDYLHRLCGIVHTGELPSRLRGTKELQDLQPSNILVELPNIDAAVALFITHQCAQVGSGCENVDNGGVANYQPLSSESLPLEVPMGETDWQLKVKVADLGMGN